MALAPEQRQELATALKKKLEKRFGKAIQHGAPGAYDPKGAMSRLVREVAAELEGEATHYQSKGDEAAAAIFRAVREELLDEVAAQVFANQKKA
ncbi:MAG: hypothetical protein EXQ98_08680 [Alphaproteobacteria bacterium]|nr:hypothetical protein [Alphaproteobacteria bacterium]